MKVSVEVKRGAVTREVTVTTYSIERALQLAGGNLPGAEARVLFPIDPDSFFSGVSIPAEEPRLSLTVAGGQPIAEPVGEMAA